jgi:hypothetical protein
MYINMYIYIYMCIYIYKCIEKGHQSMVEVLIEKGANVEVTDNDGRNALYVAIGSADTFLQKNYPQFNLDVAAPLHKDDASVLPTTTTMLTAAHTFNEASMNTKAFKKAAKDAAMMTPSQGIFLKGAEEGNVDTVTSYLKNGVGVESRNSHECKLTALIVAVSGGHQPSQAVEKGEMDNLAISLNTGADIETKGGHHYHNHHHYYYYYHYCHRHNHHHHLNHHRHHYPNHHQ